MMKQASQSKELVVRKCLCAWSDLLGFGAGLRSGRWDDIDLILPTLERVVALQRTVLKNAGDQERIFMVNDGVARNLDFEPRKGLFRIIGWLTDVWMAHTQINAIEHRAGNPGIRTVITAGSRITYASGDLTRAEMILARRPNWKLEDVEALFLPNYLNETAFYVPLEFQMNLAFAKAYSLEAMGSRGGLSGPRFFIDKSIIEFFLSTLNGTHFEFLVGSGSEMKPVKIEYCRGEKYNEIKLCTPDPEGCYRQSSTIKMDPEEIVNEQSSLYSSFFVMYPYTDTIEYQNSD